MFQGADVSGLDAMAQKAQDGADYAKKVAMALKILVRALKAMSWTGWAAGYAAYLEATVIPWVEATGEALENFAKVLRMASALQKAVSEDSPRVAIPASAYVPPQLPTSSAVNAPSLSRPDTAVANADMPTVSVGDGAVVVIPISIGGTASSLGQTAATGGGGQVTAPSGVGWGGGTGSSGTPAGGIAPETRTTSSFGPISTSPVSGSPVPAMTAGAVPASGAALGGGGPVGSSIGLGTATGSGGSTGGPGPGGLIGGSGTGGGLGGSGTGGSIGGLGTGGSLGSSGAGIGAGSGGSGSGSDTGSGLLGSTSRATTTPGDPTVRATPVATADAGGAGLTALGAPGALTEGSSLNPAALAAPLGLAGLGAAGLGALRARSGDTGEELLD